jgi:hypothetical protein
MTAMARMTRGLGTCPICIGLCAACFALGLLVFGLGRSLNVETIALAGLAGAALFGPLLLLHALFYLVRRRTPPPSAPARRLHPVAPPAEPRSSCCGRWS